KVSKQILLVALLAQRNLVLGARAPTIVAFLTHPPEKEPPSSGEGHNLAPAPRFLELPSVVPERNQEASRNLPPTVGSTLYRTEPDGG
ncbi:hypothetical protein M9458_034981, partial [Cirrhinus mrigala]